MTTSRIYKPITISRPDKDEIKQAISELEARGFECTSGIIEEDKTRKHLIGQKNPRWAFEYTKKFSAVLRKKEVPHE